MLLEEKYLLLEEIKEIKAPSFYGNNSEANKAYKEGYEKAKKDISGVINKA